MKLSDYFDKIFIIGELNSPKVEHTIESLKKLGLYDENILLHMYIPLNDFDIKLNFDNDINDYHHISRLSLAFAHYCIVKQAYNAGLKRVLILEDDNYFLNDISKWEEILNNIPDDCDIIKFSGFKFRDKDNPITLYDNLMKNSVFRKIDPNIDSIYDWAYSASCIGFNRKSMEIYIKNQQKFFTVADNVHGIYNFENTPIDVNIYMPTIPLSVPIDDVKKYDRNCQPNGCGFYLKFNEEDYL